MSAAEVFAAAVREARFQRGLTAQAACAAAGVSHVTWRRAERGLTLKEMSQLRIAQFCGIDFSRAPTRPEPTPDVLTSAVRTSVAAGRMRVLSGFREVTS